MEDFNKATVKETVLCLINDRSCYERIKRAITNYQSGDFTPQWLNKELKEYFSYCFRWYIREYCDKGTKSSDLWTEADKRQVKIELIDYYSLDGEDDLIPPAIAQTIKELLTTNH